VAGAPLGPKRKPLLSSGITHVSVLTRNLKRWIEEKEEAAREAQRRLESRKEGGRASPKKRTRENLQDNREPNIGPVSARATTLKRPATILSVSTPVKQGITFQVGT
jgi:hypothetical protein